MIASDPNDVAPVYLKADEQIPLESRPTVLAHFPTHRQEREYARKLEAARALLSAKNVDEEAIAKALLDTIGMLYAGCRNVSLHGVAVDPKETPDGFLTSSELWELAYAIPTATSIAERDRRGSVSQRESAQAASAEPVPPASA
jgi:hypothetical protein